LAKKYGKIKHNNPRCNNLDDNPPGPSAEKLTGHLSCYVPKGLTTLWPDDQPCDLWDPKLYEAK